MAPSPAPLATRSEPLATATLCTHPVTSGGPPTSSAGSTSSGQPLGRQPAACGTGGARGPCALRARKMGLRLSCVHSCVRREQGGRQARTALLPFASLLRARAAGQARVDARCVEREAAACSVLTCREPSLAPLTHSPDVTSLQQSSVCAAPAELCLHTRHHTPPHTRTRCLPRGAGAPGWGQTAARPPQPALSRPGLSVSRPASPVRLASLEDELALLGDLPHAAGAVGAAADGALGAAHVQAQHLPAPRAPEAGKQSEHATGARAAGHLLLPG